MGSIGLAWQLFVLHWLSLLKGFTYLEQNMVSARRLDDQARDQLKKQVEKLGSGVHKISTDATKTKLLVLETQLS